MKNVLLKIAMTIATLATVGCSHLEVDTYADPCHGIGAKLEVGVLGNGEENGQCVMQNGQRVPLAMVQQQMLMQANQHRKPGAITASIFKSLDRAAAPIAKNGLKEKIMDCDLGEEDGQGGYRCDSTFHAESLEVFGQRVAPGGRRDQY